MIQLWRRTLAVPLHIYQYCVLLSRGQPVAFYGVAVLGFLSGLSESLGLAMFLPLLNGTFSTSNNVTLGTIGTIVSGFFDFLNIPMRPINILTTVLMFFVLKGILRYFETIIRSRVQASFVHSLRQSLISSYRKLDYPHFLKSSKGSLAGLFTSEMTNSQSAFGNYQVFLVGLAQFASFLCFALLSNFFMTLFSLVLGGLAGFGLKRLAGLASQNSRASSMDALCMNSLMLQALNSFKYLKASSEFDSFEKLLLKSSQRQAQFQIRRGKLEGLLIGLQQPISAVILVALIAWDHRVNKVEMAASLVTLLIIYKMMQTLMQVQGQWQNFAAMRGHLDTVLESIRQFRAHQEKMPEPLEASASPEFSNWEFTDVSLSLGKKEILKSCSFKIPTKSFIGIVGRSGGGKTTLLDLVSGLILPERGKLIDGRGLSHSFEILRNYRARLGLVTQDTLLFAGTLLYNITLRYERRDEMTPVEWARLELAIQYSACREFIDQLAAGAETLVGDGHIQLSGGQKQRIALAREIFKNPDIFLLDEATSALDVFSEAEVIKGLERLSLEKTVLLVTHRPNVLKHCDEIWVVNDGHIVEQGPFLTLLGKKNGYFRELIDNDLLLPTSHNPRVRPQSDLSLYISIRRNDQDCSVSVANISLTGIGLKLDATSPSFMPGDICEVQIHAAGEEHPVSLRIVHANSESVGAHFVDLGEKSSNFVRRLVNGRVAA